MRCVRGDLFAYTADAICITTNGDVNSRGLAVMGRGVARQVSDRIPNIRRTLGHLLRQDGNVVNLLQSALPFEGFGYAIVSFPVKEHWYEPASLGLIWNSALELIDMTDHFRWQTVALPRPGCGNGGLAWADVEPILDEAFANDPRFIIVDLES